MVCLFFARMGSGSTELATRARTVFDELGYTVVGDGPEFRAEREWKVVRVTATDDDPEPPGGGGLHCFVTRSEKVRSLRRHLASRDPDCEWAVIGVDGDEFQVERAPPGPGAPT